MELKLEGICKYCNKSIAGRAMARHLLACVEKKKANSEDNGNERIFLIKAGAEPFWVYFEVNSSDNLEKIDSFLRELWLECCGHLSSFIIEGANYNSDGYIDIDPIEDKELKSMNIQLGKVLRQGLAFNHEYDFGTTTKLGLRLLSERLGKKLEKIEVVTRNNMPDFKCACGKPSKEICTECLWEKGEEAMLCDQCAKEHECDEEMFLPVVNSPRMGICGYTGD